MADKIRCNDKNNLISNLYNKYNNFSHKYSPSSLSSLPLGGAAVAVAAVFCQIDFEN